MCRILFEQPCKLMILQLTNVITLWFTLNIYSPHLLSMRFHLFSVLKLLILPIHIYFVYCNYLFISCLSHLFHFHEMCYAIKCFYMYHCCYVLNIDLKMSARCLLNLNYFQLELKSYISRLEFKLMQCLLSLTNILFG